MTRGRRISFGGGAVGKACAGLLAGLVLAVPFASAEVVELTIVHTNDIHGGIHASDATFMSREFPPRLGGAASMATVLKRLRAQVEADGGHFLLMDSGDIFQGTPIGNMTKGRAIVDFLNSSGYDIWALGNHEFDEGLQNCKDLVERARFPVLAANLVEEGTVRTVDWVRPWVIRDFGGLRVGIIGLITCETENMSFPGNVEGLDFRPVIPTVRSVLPVLEERGVDIVLMVGHLGVPYDREGAYETRARDGWREEEDSRNDSMDLAHSVTGVDAMFCGHIHKGFDDAFEDPDSHALLFQTYGRGSGAGIVTLSIDTETDQIVDHRFWTERGYLLSFFEDEFWPDPEVAEVIRKEVLDAEKGMDRLLGRATGVFSRRGTGVSPESPMGDAVCDAMLEETDADFSFTNLGGIRDEFGPGSITPRDCFQVLPFGNKMVLFKMSGTLLREVVEMRISGGHHGLYIGGGRLVYDMTRPDFDRVTSFEVGGKPWDPDAVYRVVTSDFLAQGNANLSMLPGVPEALRSYTGKTMRQALENWIQLHSPVTPATDGRWVEEPGAEQSPALRAATAEGASSGS